MNLKPVHFILVNLFQVFEHVDVTIYLTSHVASQVYSTVQLQLDNSVHLNLNIRYVCRPTHVV